MAKDKKVRITQTRGTIKRPKRQCMTLKALGLGKLGKSVELEPTPSLQGMINKVSHMVKVVEL